MLESKTIVLGVTGSIAAYKIANLASALVKLHADVHVIMTANATNFITPYTFETLTHNKCVVDTFDRNFEYQVGHISLAEKADMMLIAPATANVIAKLAHGIADDMLTTVALACKAPIYISPAMNTAMYENPITQDNIKICENYGMHIINPATGYLACGTSGIGKMPEPEQLLEVVKQAVAFDKDLAGKNILVNAGPTAEAIDPVRYITNHSTGKMGYEIARAAAYRGANVTLVTGPTSLPIPANVTAIKVTSAADMYDAVTKNAPNQDAIILSAAVADYTPSEVADHKIKKKDGDMSIPLSRTKDILGTLGEAKLKAGSKKPYLCGFSMETENLVENSRKKLVKKHVDMIVANSLNVEGAGFGVDTNVVTLITNDDDKQLPLLTKEEVAHEILNYIP